MVKCLSCPLAAIYTCTFRMLWNLTMVMHGDVHICMIWRGCWVIICLYPPSMFGVFVFIFLISRAQETHLTACVCLVNNQGQLCEKVQFFHLYFLPFSIFISVQMLNSEFVTGMGMLRWHWYVWTLRCGEQGPYFMCLVCYVVVNGHLRSSFCSGMRRHYFSGNVRQSFCLVKCSNFCSYLLISMLK